MGCSFLLALFRMKLCLPPDSPCGSMFLPSCMPSISTILFCFPQCRCGNYLKRIKIPLACPVQIQFQSTCLFLGGSMAQTLMPSTLTILSNHPPRKLKFCIKPCMVSNNYTDRKICHGGNKAMKSEVLLLWHYWLIHVGPIITKKTPLPGYKVKSNREHYCVYITCGYSIFGDEYKSKIPPVFDDEYESARRNHLNISSFWKPLAASCVCVWLKFEYAFSIYSSPAQTHLSPAPKVFVLSTKVFVFYLEGALEPPPKRTETTEKVSVKFHFHLEMGLKKYRNEVEIKERKKTTLHLLCVCQVVFLHSFISG